MNLRTALIVGAAALVGSRLLASSTAKPCPPAPPRIDPGQIAGGPFARPVLGNQTSTYWNRDLPIDVPIRNGP